MTNRLEHPSTVPPITQNLTSAPDVHQDFAKLLDGVGLDPKDTGGEVTFTGADPILPSKHGLGAIMAMGMMGPAVATQIFYRMRGGPAQDLSVDLRKAVAHINPLFLFKPTAGGTHCTRHFCRRHMVPWSSISTPLRTTAGICPPPSIPTCGWTGPACSRAVW